MKRKMTTLIALVLAVLLSVMTFVPTAQGQQQRKKPVAATGVFTPAAGQLLRITVAGGGGSDTITIRFAWKRFVGGTCSAIMGATVCRHTVASEGMSAPVTLEPNGAASLDFGGDGNGVQVMVFNNDGDPIVQVVAQIMDSQGKIVAVWTACGVN